ncbi:MAG: lipoyl(octanoyl) transferase LipB [Alphaproteobacteria bacterium]
MTLPLTSPAERLSSPTLAESSPDWLVSQGLVAYPDALEAMEKRVEAIYTHAASELIWLLEHPPLITSGTSAKATDLITPDRFPVYAAGRGGQYTYHGPGQRIAYVMLDLRQRGQDLRKFISMLEDWIIQTLNAFGIQGERREGRVGIWVSRPDGREDKIAAIGVRIRRWITYHGLAINLAPDLEHFSSIVPCGISAHGVTSIRELGRDVKMAELDEALRERFGVVFSDRIDT